MRDGIVEQVARALEIFRRPANVFVARFVGSPAMNLWACRCNRVGGGLRAISPALSIDLARVEFAVADGGELWIGVRPHDIELNPAGLNAASGGDGVGRVEVVEPLGPATLVHLRVDGVPDELRREGPYPFSELVRAVVGADSAIAVGDRLRFSLRRDRLHVFDGEGKRRLN
jgi:ABC-type sugar transport system ATPase subunit